MDHVISGHAAYNKMLEEKNATVGGQDTTTYEYLNNLVLKLAEDRGCHIAHLTKDLHVWPDFHGNRSPLADPTLKGMVRKHWPLFD